MKKLTVILVALLFAAPAFAGITVECVNDVNVITVRYEMSGGDANRPRAFGLDITLSNDANIGPITDLNPNFYVYPGQISIVGGVVTSFGSPVAAGGEDANNVTTEMASLWASNDPCGHTTQPPSSGVLFKFSVNKVCIVDIEENGSSGGVVMEDTEKDFTGGYVTLTDCNVLDDEPISIFHRMYGEWRDMDKPASWAYPRHCRGDADNAQEEIGHGNWFWVGFDDFDIFLTNWLDDAGATSALQADFSHSKEEIGHGNYFRCGFDDFAIFLYDWLDEHGADANCVSYY